METLVIINKVAAKAREVWPFIERQLSEANFSYQPYVTRQRGDATKRTRTALREGANTIVVVGGDGTLSEVTEGFFEFNSNTDIDPTQINPDANLAVLPAGTGDDFARGLQNERVPLQHWIDILINKDQRETVPVDVLYGRCNGFQDPFICLNASTIGIGGETAGRVASQGKFMRMFSGEFRFLYAALGSLATWRERRVRVIVDGENFSDGPMNLIAITNGPYAGGGMMLSPDSRNNDGLLDVVTATGFSRFEIAYELSRVHRGGHVVNPKVEISRGKIARVETFMLKDSMPVEVDGNVRGKTPVEFRVLPGALKFIHRLHRLHRF